MLDANKILGAYQAKGYKYDVGPDVFNICYIEGLDPDGTANQHIPNHWDDLRVVWQVIDGKPRIVGAWEATTRAGQFFEILHPMQPEGAFHIALGQQTAWTMGQYHDQTALIQTEPLKGTRDVHRDYQRNGPPLEGVFGVHHHWGYNYPHDDLGRSSAGCQVGRTTYGHNEFIQILKRDKRYQQDHKHVWTSTVITADEYAYESPGPISSVTVPAVLTGAGAGGIIASIPHLGTWSHISVLIASTAFLMAVGGIVAWYYHHKRNLSQVKQ